MNIDDYRNLTAMIVLNCLIIVNHIVFDLKRSYFRKNRIFASFRASEKLIENKLIEAPKVEIEKWHKYLGIMYKGVEHRWCNVCFVNTKHCFSVFWVGSDGGAALRGTKVSKDSGPRTLREVFRGAHFEGRRDQARS